MMPGSDARVETPSLLSWTFRGGKLTRLQVLGAGSDYPKALEKAGLSDQPGA
jgi:hypothetical protein